MGTKELWKKLFKNIKCDIPIRDCKKCQEEIKKFIQMTYEEGKEDGEEIGYDRCKEDSEGFAM